MSSTILPQPVEHAAVHRLACACGARCPDCGGGRGTLRAQAVGEEAADFAMRVLARGRQARPRAFPPPATPQPRRAARTTNPRNPPLPAPVRTELRDSVRALGWSGWQRPAGGPVTLRDLQEFRARGGVEPARPGGRPGLRVSDRGWELLRQPRFARLSTLFVPRAHGTPRHLYEIVPRGRLQAPLYIGTTARAPGLRVLEHLVVDRGPAGARLREMQTRGQLGTVEIGTGRFQVPDLGRRSHLGEVMLQELHNPAWNDPRRHGFEE